MPRTTSRPPGDSQEQREAEEVIIRALSVELGVPLVPTRLPLTEGSYLEIDGVSKRPAILCEAWAHLGAPKGGQRQKVMMDAFKLAFAAQHWGRRSPRLLLAFADDAAAKPFRGRSWMAHALSAFGITIHVVNLPSGLREKVAEAQRRQHR